MFAASRRGVGGAAEAGSQRCLQMVVGQERRVFCGCRVQLAVGSKGVCEFAAGSGRGGAAGSGVGEGQERKVLCS